MKEPYRGIVVPITSSYVRDSERMQRVVDRRQLLVGAGVLAASLAGFAVLEKSKISQLKEDGDVASADQENAFRHLVGDEGIVKNLGIVYSDKGDEVQMRGMPYTERGTDKSSGKKKGTVKVGTPIPFAYPVVGNSIDNPSDESAKGLWFGVWNPNKGYGDLKSKKPINVVFINSRYFGPNDKISEIRKELKITT